VFDFFKKKKKQQEAEDMERKMQVAREIRAKKEQQLVELLDGNKSYKMFSWGFGFNDKNILRDSFLPLKSWEPIENVFTLLEKEYENIEEGSFTLIVDQVMTETK